MSTGTDIDWRPTKPFEGPPRSAAGSRVVLWGRPAALGHGGTWPAGDNLLHLHGSRAGTGAGCGAIHPLVWGRPMILRALARLNRAPSKGREQEAIWAPPNGIEAAELS